MYVYISLSLYIYICIYRERDEPKMIRMVSGLAPRPRHNRIIVRENRLSNTTRLARTFLKHNKLRSKLQNNITSTRNTIANTNEEKQTKPQT